MNQLATAILVIVGAILPVVNPLGDAPLFLQLTYGCDGATRARLAWGISIYSFALLLGSLVLGTFVLRLFDLSLSVIQVAGGIVVCALGWKMLTFEPRAPEASVDPDQTSAAALARVFYPLTLPLTIDPGVMSVAVTIGAHHAHTLDRIAIQLAAAVIGAGIVAACILVCYRYAERVAKRIGRSGMSIIMRLCAFIVFSIGVQITWNGITALLKQIGIATSA